MEELTSAQKRVLGTVKEYHVLKGYPPSIREIAQSLGYKSTKAVHVHLKNLEEKGYIRRSSGARSIEINSEFMRIPVLGVISAGRPLLSEEHMENMFIIPEAEGSGRFFLKINGDSMTGAGLENGDMVLVDRNSEAKNGDIVVAIVNGESTVKTLVKQSDRIILRPENPDYQPLIVGSNDDMRIIGIVVGNLKFF